MESKAIPGQRNGFKRVQKQETGTYDSCSGNGEESSLVEAQTCWTNGE